jgi:hypothetical protein
MDHPNKSGDDKKSGKGVASASLRSSRAKRDRKQGKSSPLSSLSVLSNRKSKA